jgi:multicomponent Na+:H+ antiporter subunit C
MTMVLAICVAVTFGVSIYLMLGSELKGIAMGVFLLGHAANLSIIAMSGSPILHSPTTEKPHAPATLGLISEHFDEQRHPLLSGVNIKQPPVLEHHEPMADPLATIADPLPQALILTAIVISFGVMAFLLTLLVVTSRRTHTLAIAELAQAPAPEPDGGPTQA